LEDALKSLEKLTNEEVRMATAQVLKATHNVNDRVAAVDDKVAVVIDGAQLSFIGQKENMFDDICLEGRGARVVIQQVADDMDQVKSMSFSFCVDVQAKPSLQGINYVRTFAGGSLRRIPLLTTILPAAPIASKQRIGFSKEVSSPNGNPMAHSCGSMENVRSIGLSTADAR
jgi:hypothetical protein